MLPMTEGAVLAKMRKWNKYPDSVRDIMMTDGWSDSCAYYHALGYRDQEQHHCEAGCPCYCHKGA